MASVITVTILLALLLSSTALAFTISKSTIVVTGLVGKSSSQTSSNEYMDYIATQTRLYNNDTLKNYNHKEYWGHSVCGPISAYWTGIGTKTARGQHWWTQGGTGGTAYTYDS